MPSFNTLKEDVFPELAENFSPFRRGDKPELVRPDQRLSFGIAKRGVEYRVMLMVEKDGGWAHKRALKMQEKEPEVYVVEVIGTAQAGKPEDKPKARVIESQVLRPGLSVSHEQGLPGTLGCIVTHRTARKQEVPGFVSASHVLGNMNRATPGTDFVIHPGNIDIVPNALNRVGLLRDYVLLRHHSDAPMAGALGNGVDVGVAEIEDEDRVGENLVPSPEDPDNKTIKIHNVVPLDEMVELIDQKVFKIGRTTGFTLGVLAVAVVTQQPLTLLDNRVYLYRDVAVVHSSNPGQPFSEPGDSGSVVYTKDGRGVGLVIGGTARYTLISPLEPSLKQVRAELYT